MEHPAVGEYSQAGRNRPRPAARHGADEGECAGREDENGKRDRGPLRAIRTEGANQGGKQQIE